MAYEECAPDGTSVGVCVFSTQNTVIVIVIVVIDGPVECQQNHLRNLKHEEKKKMS